MGRGRCSIPGLLCLAMLAACQGRQPGGSLLPDTLRLREGDVVFRRCTGLTSHLVVANDREGVFSHTGIVVDSAGILMVAHAVPDEPDFPGDPDRVKLESVERFFDSRRAVAAGVARHPDADVAHRAARYALMRYRQGTLFDHGYNDDDTLQLYCTQLVALAYERAGVQLVDSVREVVSLPSFHYRCILPSQLQHSPELNFLFMYNS